DEIPPSWPSGRSLIATEEAGRVHLFWKAAADAEGVYGYEILRSESGEREIHLTTVKGCSYNDYDVVAGVTYTYRVRAYDLAGNRSEASDPAEAILSYPEAGRARMERDR